jgi:hypothetical protein
MNGFHIEPRLLSDAGGTPVVFARRKSTVLVACGQKNLPRSNRFANKHRPSPDHHKSLIKSLSVHEIRKRDQKMDFPEGRFAPSRSAQ